jgi:hypothetical protein
MGSDLNTRRDNRPGHWRCHTHRPGGWCLRFRDPRRRRPLWQFGPRLRPVGRRRLKQPGSGGVPVDARDRSPRRFALPLPARGRRSRWRPADLYAPRRPRRNLVAVTFICLTFICLGFRKLRPLLDRRMSQALLNMELERMADQTVGNRPDRIEPQAVKRRPKPYRLLTMLRATAQTLLRRGIDPYKKQR